MSLTRPKYSQIYDTDWKQSVEVATVGSDIGNLIAGNTQPTSVDGFALSVGNRILVKDQTDATQNGIYRVANVGGGANGWWVRSLDANQSAFVTSGMTVVVDGGAVNKGQEFRLITQDPITLGNTSLVFTNQTAMPGGANTQIQFYDTISGVPLLSGNPGFTYNKVSNAVVMTGNLSVYGVNAIGNISTPLLNAGQINTTGNVLATNAVLNALTINGTTTSTGFINTTANISTAQLNAGQINTTGNVLATNAVLNALTVNGVTTQSGNLNVTNGNLNVTGTIWITGNILPTANVTYNLGSPTNKFKSAYFSGNTVYIGSESMGVDSSGTWQFSSAGSTVTLGANAIFNPVAINVSGNVTAANLTAPLITATTNLTAANITAPFIGNTGAQITGTIVTPSQTNITSVGSLTTLNVSGNTTIGGNLFVLGTITTIGNVNNITITGNAGQFFGNTAGFGALYAGIGTGYTVEPQTILQLSSNYNGYAQLNLQNINAGSTASGDIVVTMDTGNTTQGYIDLGINSSLFVGGAGNELNYPGDGYLYVQGNIGGPGGNLLLSTDTPADIVFALNGQGSANEIGRFINSNKSFKVTGNINATGNVLGVVGNFGTVNTTGNILSTGAVFNALTVNGATTLAGTLTVSSGFLNSAGNIVATGGIFNSLTVNGLITQGITTANTVTTVLTHGSDVNFQLTAQNGYNNSTGSEVARFGINYSGTGWDSFTQYIRGGAAQNGYLSFWAANAPIANVSSTGLTVTGVINASGNVLSTGAIHNTLTVNGTASTNVASVASTILAGAVGVTGNIIANASVIYGNTSGGYGVRQFFNPITNSLDTVFG